MSVMGSLRELISPKPAKMWGAQFVHAQKQLSTPLEDILARQSGSLRRVWKPVSVPTALGVPAIQRAVSLIASTTGMLSVQAYRDGVPMPDPPPIVVRPDPYQTPGAFYSGSAANMAKYGEIVWWIATHDGDGLAAALVNVPLNELQVRENQSDRRLPFYAWGDRTGTRYSGANREGRFVHVMYPTVEPFALRGSGPLQICGAANSVAVESQEWAANFYGEGGQPSTIIKKAGILSPTKLDPETWLPMDPLDPDYETKGRSEADLLRDQVIARANNTTMVTDDGYSVDLTSPNTIGAQMLDARSFNNGDAAREFGIPGPLLEYQQPGGSLTYQNRTELKGALLEMCLMPLYLEPMEQALSDLLTRSTVARFNVKGFLRADIKTRFEVHKLAIDSGVYDAPYAQREEGIAPGDVEFAPVPFAPPVALPAPIRRMSAGLQDARCPKCNKFLAKTLGPGSELDCPRCKTTVRNEMSASEETRPFVVAPIININVPEQPAPIVNVTNPPPPLRIRRMERDDRGNLTIRDEHVQEGVA
jgi:phage portal protein BeeE/phage FluMu protein Com